MNSLIYLVNELINFISLTNQRVLRSSQQKFVIMLLNPNFIFVIKHFRVLRLYIFIKFLIIYYTLNCLPKLNQVVLQFLLFHYFVFIIFLVSLYYYLSLLILVHCTQILSILVIIMIFKTIFQVLIHFITLSNMFIIIYLIVLLM